MGMRKRYVGLLLNLTLAAFALALTLAATEAALHVLAPNEDNNSGHLYNLEWNRDCAKPCMLPHARAVHRGVPITTNAYGLRDVEIAVPKPSGTYRILMVGDSFVFGQGVPQLSQTIPKQLEAKLAGAAERRVEVINFGVCGLNTFQEFMMYVQQGRRFEPDLVLLVWIPFDHELNGYRYEDLDYFLRHRTLPHDGSAPATSGAAAAGRARRMGLGERLERTYTVMYFGRRLKSVLMKWGFNLNRYEEAQHSDIGSEGYRLMYASLKSFAETCAAEGVPFETVLFPGLQTLDSDHYQRLIYSKIETYCGAHGIRCFNLFPAFKGKNAERLHVSILDAHPNAEAAAIAADALARHLRPQIPPPSPKPALRAGPS